MNDEGCHTHGHRRVQDAAGKPMRESLPVREVNVNRLHVLQIVPHRIRSEGRIEELLDLCNEHDRQGVRQHLSVVCAPHDVNAPKVPQDDAEHQGWNGYCNHAPSPVGAADTVQLPLRSMIVVRSPPDFPVHAEDHALLLRFFCQYGTRLRRIRPGAHISVPE
eukprot:CAMPEP_0115266022 /NCGR_PEP_ID=MMETSP0270-20121206/51251_1 /TAXON_ID=71861 /ORGANISM="Scrippsiella trochoidea, Strain CCMP3099" /LENGTH=162 /DNA_ID=CAMNT_0002682101 /DNA_START=72 /DNA_END=560 /DNA_ORIENTATION=-